MNCSDVRELLPAYALGALDADEAPGVEAHLRECREHDAELAELRATVFALDRYADEADLGVPDRVPGGGGLAAIGRFRQWQMAIAAAILVLAFGAGWLASDLAGDEPRDVTIVIQGGSGERLALQDSGRESVTVSMAGFTRLPQAQAYQLWAVRDGVWLRIGICNTNEQGGWMGDFEFSVRAGEQIALTIEPAKGSEKPTSEPLLASNF
jgi:anti-sigma-K factor RskA